MRKSSRGRTFAGGFIEPMHARLVETLPDGDDWLYEVKLDGYRALAHQASIASYAFDLLHVNGADMMGRPLDERKARLRDVVAGSGVLLSDGLPGDAGSVIEAVRRLGLEGVVAKAGRRCTNRAAEAAPG